MSQGSTQVNHKLDTDKYTTVVVVILTFFTPFILTRMCLGE